MAMTGFITTVTLVSTYYGFQKSNHQIDCTNNDILMLHGQQAVIPPSLGIEIFRQMHGMGEWLMLEDI